MSKRDTFCLDRNQRADVFCAGGTLRLIADHPLNAPLIGVCSKARFVRAAELALEQGDKTVVVYVARAGREERAASAIVQIRANGAVLLTDWQVEEGFTHQRQLSEDGAVHRIVTTQVKSGGASVDKALAAAPARQAPATAAGFAAGKSKKVQASGRS